LCLNIDELFKTCTSILHFSLDKTIPVKTVLVKAYRPKWLTAKFERVLHSRDSALKIFLSSRSQASWRNYRLKRNQAVLEKRKLKAEALTSAANQGALTMNSSKAEWRLLNEEIGRGKKRSSIDSVRVGSLLVTDKSEIAMYSVKCLVKHPPPNPRPVTFENTLPVFGLDYCDTLDSVEVSIPAVQHGLFKINPHKPAGIDGIPALFYKKFYS